MNWISRCEEALRKQEPSRTANALERAWSAAQHGDGEGVAAVLGSFPTGSDSLRCWVGGALARSVQPQNALRIAALAVE